VSGGGYVLGYQHIFWFYSHPAVYIMMLPGFGIISEVIAVMSRKPLRLPPDGAEPDGDRRARLLGLGAPHVRERHVRRGCACR
jgi:Heme/copper-type cytochrome/quinol oxidases, subunit 1